MGGRVEKSKGFAPKSFDRVILDATCSALDVSTRYFGSSKVSQVFDKVSCLFQETIESMRKHATYQRRMLDQAVQLVRRVEFLCIHASSCS
ncbi:hypothetical protein COP2_047274 [Malus domestica]